MLMIKKDPNIIYIYKVVYGQKSHYETHDVIKEVYYVQWNDTKSEFVTDNTGLQTLILLNSINPNLKMMAGLRVGITNFRSLVEVSLVMQQDGEVWIRTNPDSTERNNLENLVDYAKFNSFAEKENKATII